MQRQLDFQLACEKLLETDKRLMYSGCLDGSGSIIAESIREAITNYEHLTVVVLPINARRNSLVLASVVGSDLISIVENSKKVFSPKSSIPLILEA
jgi:hypothetical protein